MSTKPKVVKKKPPVVPPMSLKELGELMVRHYGFKKGKYEVLVEFMIGMGAVGPKDKPVPGAMIGLTKVGLQKTEIDGPNTVDAADLQLSE